MRHLDRHRACERRLVERLWDGVARIRQLRPFGRPPGKCRVGILAVVTITGHPELEWVPLLRARNVIARGGLHCSPGVHEQLGVLDKGSLRLSVGQYTSMDDVDRAVAVLGEVSDTMAELHA